MAVILENRPVAADTWRLTVATEREGAPGQFYMLRPASGSEPFLPRPISIMMSDEQTTVFCYRQVGRGTELMTRLVPGQHIELTGPLGNGFPVEVAAPGQRAVLVGGGMGIAPLCLLAKKLRQRGCQVEAYLGLSGENSFPVGEMEPYAHKIHTQVGGFITEAVTAEPSCVYYACGPLPMVRALYQRIPETELYVSLEKRMACGVGACLGCSIDTRSGRQRVCKDGPVFAAKEVFDVPSEN